MRFEVRRDEKSKKADYEVSFIVTTQCVINNSKRVTVALGDVKLNHKDKFDLKIGAREALKKALHDFLLTDDVRKAIWECYCKAFGIPAKVKHKKIKATDTDSLREHYDLGKLLTDGIVGKYAKKGGTNA